MITNVLGWGVDDQDPSGQHTLRVTSAEQLDAALDRITGGGRIHLVDVYEEVPDAGDAIPPYGFQIVWGHPERAAMTWLGDEGGDAVDPSLPPWPEPIDYDHGEALPYRTRVAPAQVRTAVCEYVHSGQRPTTITGPNRPARLQERRHAARSCQAGNQHRGCGLPQPTARGWSAAPFGARRVAGPGRV